RKYSSNESLFLAGSGIAVGLLMRQLFRPAALENPCQTLPREPKWEQARRAMRQETKNPPYQTPDVILTQLRRQMRLHPPTRIEAQVQKAKTTSATATSPKPHAA